MKELLRLENYSIHTIIDEHEETLLAPFSFNLNEGEKVIVIGESGSGKTMLASSLLNLLPSNCFTKGEMYFDNQLVNNKLLTKLRGKEISLIPQGGKDHLNENRRLKHIFFDELKLNHLKMNQQEMEKLFNKVNLPLALLKRYSFEISGGEATRFMIALSLIKTPKLLLLDEPTYGLDEENKKLFIETFLNNLASSSALFITHDLSLIKYFDRVLIFNEGKIIEDSLVKNFLKKPKEKYSKTLLNAYLKEDE